MKNHFIIYVILLFGLAGCSGIGGTGGTIDDTVTTPKTQKVYKGKVNQVNSKTQEISVNGVQFKLNEAQVIRDSANIKSDEIKTGQIITIEALDSNEDGIFEASKITINEQLRGPIEEIDLNSMTIKIFSQTVLITQATSFTQKSLSTLVVNNYLAIFGFRREDGVIEATLIELVKEDFSSALDTVNVAGEVSDIDYENGTITIDGVIVNVGPTDIKDINIGDTLSLENLEINSSVPDGISTNTSEPSTLVEDQDYDIDSEIVLEGIPRYILSRNNFSLNGYQVFVPIELMESNNIDSVKNRQIIIEGVFVGKKEILAKSIIVEQTKDFELRGSLNAGRTSDSILVFNQIIMINRFTSINFDLDSLLEEIETGLAEYTVFVKGYIDNSGNSVALYISLKSEETERTEYIEGKIESIVDSVVTVSGIEVRLKDLVEYQNLNITLSGADLLELLSVGDNIEIHGEFNENKVFLVNSLSNSSLTSSEEEEVQINQEPLN